MYSLKAARYSFADAQVFFWITKNSLKESRSEYYKSTWNNVLTYNFNIADMHHFNLLGGYSEILYKEKGISALGYDYYNNSILALSQSEQSTRVISSSYPEWRLRSLFGRFNYDFMNT